MPAWISRSIMAAHLLRRGLVVEIKYFELARERAQASGDVSQCSGLIRGKARGPGFRAVRFR